MKKINIVLFVVRMKKKIKNPNFFPYFNNPIFFLLIAVSVVMNMKKYLKKRIRLRY